jgi:hypothetical protein
MFKEMSQLMGLLQQARGLSDKMEGVQQRLAARRCVGTAGDGVVTIEMNGLGQTVGCTLDIVLFERVDHVTRERWIVEAVNAAQEQVRAAAGEELQKAAGGMDLGRLKGLLGG